MTDGIEKNIDLKAPISRVWKALTDHKEFGAWFRVDLDGPFKAGEASTGRITVPGFEHVPWNSTVTAIEPERYFAYTWHPYAIESDVDYSKEPPTLVEFRLEPKDGGTLLAVTESGFDKIPAHRRAEAFRMNDGGWAAQIKNIAKHVAG